MVWSDEEGEPIFECWSGKDNTRGRRMTGQRGIEIEEDEKTKRERKREREQSNQVWRLSDHSSV